MPRCCLPARRAGSRCSRRWRWARARSRRWSRTRSCSAQCATGSARRRPRPPTTRSGSRRRARSPSPGTYDLVDIAGDFLDAAEANDNAFTAEAIAGYLRHLSPGGLVSIPVSIREFPVYAVRVLATVRQALLAANVADPAANVVVYRSAWNVRILVEQPGLERRRASPPCGPGATRARSTSPIIPGIDVAAARANIYNDLPPVDFTSGEVETSAGSQDAVADEAGPVLRGEASPSQQAFDLRPITLDRPFYYNILRLGRLPDILRRLEILPQAEVGQLVNLAVLAQAVVIALLVLAVPVFAPRVAGPRARRAPILRPIIYFASLGLGFLFIEIFLIEKASLYLNDRTSAFAAVLTGMLVFSGLGSLLADKLPNGGIAIAAGVVIVWCGLALTGLEPFLLATLGLPWAARAVILIAIIAPVSVALGLPFPLGLARAAPGRDFALGLGAERRLFRGGHATGQSSCRARPGSTLY